MYIYTYGILVFTSKLNCYVGRRAMAASSPIPEGNQVAPRWAGLDERHQLREVAFESILFAYTDHCLGYVKW